MQGFLAELSFRAGDLDDAEARLVESQRLFATPTSTWVTAALARTTLALELASRPTRRDALQLARAAMAALEHYRGLILADPLVHLVLARCLRGRGLDAEADATARAGVERAQRRAADFTPEWRERFLRHPWVLEASETNAPT